MLASEQLAQTKLLLIIFTKSATKSLVEFEFPNKVFSSPPTTLSL